LRCINKEKRTERKEKRHEQFLSVKQRKGEKRLLRAICPFNYFTICSGVNRGKGDKKGGKKPPGGRKVWEAPILRNLNNGECAGKTLILRRGKGEAPQG